MEIPQKQENQKIENHIPSLEVGQDYRIGLSNMSDCIGQPLQHSGCTILICTKGYAVISFNLHKQILRKGNIALIFADNICVVEQVSQNLSVHYVVFSGELFDEATFTLSFSFFDTASENTILYPSPSQHQAVKSWEQQINWIAGRSPSKASRLLMRNYLQSFFVALEQELTETPSTLEKNINSPRRFFIQFCNLLVDHCHKEHGVKFYADKLCITPYYLYKITYSTIKMSPKELINSQLILEIKMLLSSTYLSIKEISQKLGFEEPSYLSRFFRRHTGKSPTEFRQ